MSEEKIPFFAQAAILDEFIKSSNPGENPEILEIVLNSLSSNKELHDYFFRSSPTSAWVAILHNHNFFRNPPSPIIKENGYSLPRWFEQEFLISKAHEFPDIVLSHIKSIQDNEYYLSGAIESLCAINVQKSKDAIPIIKGWLKKADIAYKIASASTEFVKKLAQDGEVDAAFDLFDAIIEPLPPKNPKNLGDTELGKFWMNTEAISKFPDWHQTEVLSIGQDILAKTNAIRLSHILEKHLCSAIQFEMKAEGQKSFKLNSWWRNAIEDTDQDRSSHYKDELLVALRKVLEELAEHNVQLLKPILDKYLKEKNEILRRLGFHLLNKYPKMFKDLVIKELLKKSNISELSIHHEFFLLLRNGYECLNMEQQKNLITIIRDGPPPKTVEKMGIWAKKELGIEPKKYEDNFSKVWIRDRLWMIKDHLNNEDLIFFKSIISEFGNAKHPDFTGYLSEVGWVEETSPLQEDNIKNLSGVELLGIVKQYKPNSEGPSLLKRESYEAFANIVAKVLLNNPEKYQKQFISIGLHRSEYATAIFEQIKQRDSIPGLCWSLCIDLCEKMLQNDFMRTDLEGKKSGFWVWTRKRIINFFQDRFKLLDSIPIEYIERIKKILFVLLNDPDPDSKSDRPEPGWMGAEDPATIAVNHARPEALSALIELSLFKIPEETRRNEKPGPQRLDDDIKDVLTKILDKQTDPSWAVHSIYGRYLWILYWLDKDWVEKHINQIFPDAQDEDNLKFFVAAWDSFVIFNDFKLLMEEMLHAKYEKAISNLSKGYVTKTHLDPEKGLARHLIGEYITSDKDIYSGGEHKPLIVKFFETVEKKHWAGACWVLWRNFEDNRSEIDKYWQKIKSFCEWRINIASKAGNTIDFDEEIVWLAHLPSLAPSFETIKTLWPLLEGMLPHITRSIHANGWSALEKYLSQEVENNPKETINYFYLMHERKNPELPIWQHEEEKIIIETALQHMESREKALDLIELFARSNNFLYKELYDNYST